MIWTISSPKQTNCKLVKRFVFLLDIAILYSWFVIYALCCSYTTIIPFPFNFNMKSRSKSNFPYVLSRNFNAEMIFPATLSAKNRTKRIYISNITKMSGGVVSVVQNSKRPTSDGRQRRKQGLYYIYKCETWA